MKLTEARTTNLILSGLLIAALSSCASSRRSELPGPGELSPPHDDIPANVEAASRDNATPPPGLDPQAASSSGKSADGAKGQKDADSESPSSKVIVIERAKSTRGTTLVEAARAARESRGKSGPSVASVTNKNLKDYQDAHVTFAEPDPKSAKGKEGEASESAKTDGKAGADSKEAKGEKYWRSRVLDLRLALRGAVDRYSELQTKAAGLRRSFYAEDDPYVRDGQIKPAWDRALDQIGSTRKSIYDLEDQLSETLEEGRRAGALPGWLRAGIDLEPSADELPPPETKAKPGDLKTYEPVEPKVLDESAQQPPPSA